MNVETFLMDFFKQNRGIELDYLEKIPDMVEAEIMDSFMWMNLLMKVEEEFQCELDIDLLLTQSSINDLKNFISSSVKLRFD